MISAITGGQGNGGNISINAHDTVTFDGQGNGSPTSVETVAEANSIGNAGNIGINARELFVKNGAIIAASSISQGNAGNIFIDTRDAVVIDGISGNTRSGAFSSLSAGGVGKGGDIQITTSSLQLSNGGELVAISEGKGSAGKIIVNARDAIGIDGTTNNGISSGIFTDLQVKVKVEEATLT